MPLPHIHVPVREQKIRNGIFCSGRINIGTCSDKRNIMMGEMVWLNIL